MPCASIHATCNDVMHLHAIDLYPISDMATRYRSNSDGGQTRSPTKPKPSNSRASVKPSGSEENLLETYFVLLSKFNFDRAKDQCDREREAKSGMGGTNWCELMSFMSRLCVAETNYFSLSFMERAATFRLVRRELLKAMYESMTTHVYTPPPLASTELSSSFCHWNILGPPKLKQIS